MLDALTTAYVTTYAVPPGTEPGEDLPIGLPPDEEPPIGDDPEGVAPDWLEGVTQAEIRAALYAPSTEDAFLIAMLALREKVTTARRQRLYTVAARLREESMSLAERFVDPQWAEEAAEQRAADRAWVAAANERTRTLLADKIKDIPF